MAINIPDIEIICDCGNSGSFYHDINNGETVCEYCGIVSSEILWRGYFAIKD